MKIKKYVIKNENNTFLAKLAHSQESNPIVKKKGFLTHEDAMFWLDEELEKIKPSYDRMSFAKLAKIIETDPKDVKAKETLKYKIESLKENMLFTLVIKEDMSEKKAMQHIKQVCGKNWSESFQKAKDQTLDALVSLEEEKTQERLQNMVKYVQDSQWEGSEEAQSILNLIKKLPGSKIITANINMETESFDIDENGAVGYSIEHEKLLLKKLDMGFKNPNSFIIRQFIPNSEERVTGKNGKEITIPWKALYGFVLCEEGIISVSAEDLEHAMTHDYNDNPIKPEEMVIYKDFSEVLA